MQADQKFGTDSDKIVLCKKKRFWENEKKIEIVINEKMVLHFWCYKIEFVYVVFFFLLYIFNTRV